MIVPNEDMRTAYIIIIIVVLCVPSSGTRYMHDTGVIQLRVDDMYPAGFVELNYCDFDGFDLDVLWLAFIGIMFDEWTTPFYGRASDTEPLYESNLYPMDTLILEEMWEFSYDTLYDTVVVDYNDTVITDSVVVDSLFQTNSYFKFGEYSHNLTFYQKVSSDSGSPYIFVRWIISNEGASDLGDGRMVFHIDADVPASAWDDDRAVLIDGHLAACQQVSLTDRRCVGFVWLRGGVEQTLENTEYWFGAAVDVSAMVTLIDGDFWYGSEYCDTTGGDTICPTFIDSLYGDMGIGILLSLPDLSPEEQETLIFAFVVAPDPDSFKIIAEYLNSSDTNSIATSRRDDDFFFSPKVIAEPNPFNSFCRIVAPGADKIDVVNVSGRIVCSLSAQCGEALWQPKRCTPAGMYLLRARLGDKLLSHGKILYVK